ncbi:MAG: type II toxin-antitoxin system HicA family toxin [Planctomycetes bacterium]|nr:type II toxin-antitoxin system HicA family toxin [Planctomycetota bacterium]
MSRKLRRLSGQNVVSILEKFGFGVLSQRGSHAKLRRTAPGGEKQTLVVPLHKQIDAGTLQAIFRQASRYIPQEQLRALFYTR